MAESSNNPLEILENMVTPEQYTIFINKYNQITFDFSDVPVVSTASTTNNGMEEADGGSIKFRKHRKHRKFRRTMKRNGKKSRKSRK